MSRKAVTCLAERTCRVRGRAGAAAWHLAFSQVSLHGEPPRAGRVQLGGWRRCARSLRGPACVPGAAVRHSLTQRLRWLPRRPLPRVSACACVCTVRGHGLVEAAGPERGRGCGGERREALFAAAFPTSVAFCVRAPLRASAGRLAPAVTAAGGCVREEWEPPERETRTATPPQSSLGAPRGSRTGTCPAGEGTP